MRATQVKGFILAAVFAAPLIASAVPCQEDNCDPIVRDVGAVPALKVVVPRPKVPEPIPAIPQPHAVVPQVPRPLKPKYKEDPAAVSHKNPCGIVTARSLGKRSVEDSEDWMKVFVWLRDDSGLDPKKIVFYADTSKFAEKAEQFAEANGYHVFHNIFTFNEEFLEAFDLDDIMTYDKTNVACSKALGVYAKNPYVFNHDGAKPGSYWLDYELPMMADAGPITKLKDDAKTLADTNGVVPNPPRNAC